MKFNFDKVNPPVKIEGDLSVHFDQTVSAYPKKKREWWERIFKGCFSEKGRQNVLCAAMRETEIYQARGIDIGALTMWEGVDGLEREQHVQIEKEFLLEYRASPEGFQGQGSTGVVYTSEFYPDVVLKFIVDEQHYVGQLKSGVGTTFAEEYEMHRDIYKGTIGMKCRVCKPLGHSAPDGIEMITLERVQGKAFKDILLDRSCYPKLPLLLALDVDVVVKDIMDTLQAIHDMGYVHNDLHMGNLMIDKDLNLYIIDFGQTKKVKGHVPGRPSTSIFNFELIEVEQKVRKVFAVLRGEIELDLTNFE